VIVPTEFFVEQLLWGERDQLIAATKFPSEQVPKGTMNFLKGTLPSRRMGLNCPREKWTWNVQNFWDKSAKDKFFSNQNFYIS
jgi:hypothetical protein